MTRALEPSGAWLLMALTASSVSVMAQVSQVVLQNMITAVTKMTLVDTQAIRR